MSAHETINNNYDNNIDLVSSPLILSDDNSNKNIDNFITKENSTKSLLLQSQSVNDCENITKSPDSNNHSMSSSIQHHTRTENVQEEGEEGGGDKSEIDESLPSEPLSWRTARTRMRNVLEEYLHDTSYLHANSSIRHHERRTRSSSTTTSSNISKFCEYLTWITSHDLDCYLGSILISASLMGISITFFCIEQSRRDGDSNISYILDIHKSYIIASVILTTVSLLSTWLIHRRNQTSIMDVHLKKRRNVSSLLQVLNKLEEAHDQADRYPHMTSREPIIPNNNDSNNHFKLVGNALSDIYSVYRISSATEERAKGQWHSIPSLLLVKGDFIALQTGDTAPADCKMVTGSRFASLTQDAKKLGLKKQPLSYDTGVINAGETVKLPLRVRPDQLRNSLQSLSPWFPPGKSTLPEKSRKLLHLCGNKRVYEVLETPMIKFLQDDSVSYQSPRIHRQLSQCRNLMCILSIGLFVFTLIVVGTRDGVRSTDQLHYYYLPFMASLSILPSITPIELFIQEIIGTSRILQLVHMLSLKSSNVGAIKLFLRYFIRGCAARFSFTEGPFFRGDDDELLHFPPISMCLYEKLGLVTASVFVDDELICDPISIPEQLLIPSSSGFKLLDLFSKYNLNDEDISEDGKDRTSRYHPSLSENILKSASDDSDSEWSEDSQIRAAWRKNARKKFFLRKGKYSAMKKSLDKSTHEDKLEIEFEDPTWWRYLPSLKCIGLSCLLMEKNQTKEKESGNKGKESDAMILAGRLKTTYHDSRFRYFHGQAESALVDEVCQFYGRRHLCLLSKCIGFDTNGNAFGENGDISPFQVIKRIHVIATRILHERLQRDRHSIGNEETKSWGMLLPDTTSIVIRDNRSGAHQLLTMGNAKVITDLCTESWQGGISTITPLSLSDRKEIVETCKNWYLADLDVTCFSYAPISRSMEQSLEGQSEVYLVDNRTKQEFPASTQSEDWQILKHQIFLGMLASSISPRKCIAKLLHKYDEAGVRFVYFSSRNMRRTKEVASEMGIDVAWNSAISLSPLEEGGDDEFHKNAFGEADLNAKLPHGVQAVARHLEEVDNVPLLVRLYTDVTKTTTAEMIKIFIKHSDTVLTLGLSHFSRNNEIFSSSSLSIGIDYLMYKETGFQNQPNRLTKRSFSDSQLSQNDTNRLSAKEVSMISLISSNSCVFSLALDTGLTNLSSLIELGRAAINAGMASTHFMIFAYTSFAFMIALSSCSVSQAILTIPGLGIVINLLVIIPVIAISMGFTESNKDDMLIVPVKNDISETFSRGEGKRLIISVILKGLLPAALSQVIFLIAFGSFIIEYDAQLIIEECGLNRFSWMDVIHCDIMSSYVGAATIPSGALVTSFHALCMIVVSSSFLMGTNPLFTRSIPSNRCWILAAIFGVVVILLYLCISLDRNALNYLPWYFYLLSLITPFTCLAFCELIKKRERKDEQRAAKMRRLHFETRLGMWSPK